MVRLFWRCIELILERFTENSLQAFEKMVQYCVKPGCRRRQLLAYFGEAVNFNLNDNNNQSNNNNNNANNNNNNRNNNNNNTVFCNKCDYCLDPDRVKGNGYVCTGHQLFLVVLINSISGQIEMLNSMNSQFSGSLNNSWR